MLLLGFAIAAFLSLIFMVLAIPVVLVGLAIGAVFFVVIQLILLPFRLLGAAVGLGTGIIFAVAKLALLFLLGLFALIGLLIGFLPLLPIALIGIGLWILLRPSRRNPAVG